MSVKKRRKQGFTLAEMLIVVGIVAILLGAGSVSAAVIVKNMSETTYSANAKEVWVAAQNQLWQMRGNGGTWEKVVADHSEDQTVNGETVSVPKTEYFGYPMSAYVTTMQPSDFTYYTGSATSELLSDYYVISFSPEDENSPLENTVLEKMLPLGATDSFVRQSGRYIIEYNIKTAMVYGVIYTESDTDLWGITAGEDSWEFNDGSLFNAFYSSTGSGGTSTCRPNDSVTSSDAKINRRDYTNAAGKSVIIGYFGGALTDEIKFDTITEPDVIIYNGEDLVLHIVDGNSSKETSSHSKNRQNTEITITINGLTSGAKKVFTVEQPTVYTGQTNPEKVNRYYLKSKNNGITKEYYNIDAAEYDTNITYNIILDSIVEKEIGASGTENCHFSHLVDGSGFILGEDIEVVVTISANAEGNLVAVPVTEKFTVNSLFESVSEQTNDGGGIEIRQMRHLENLDSSISGVDLTKLYKKDGSFVAITRAYLNSNISWDGIGSPAVGEIISAAKISERDYTADGTYVTNKSGTRLLGENNYVPITIKQSNFTLDGNNYRIYNVRINVTMASGKGVGLFGNVKNVTIKNLGIVSTYTQVDSFTSGKDKTVNTKYTVTGGAGTGAFVGYATGNVVLTKCYSTVQISQTANATGYVGGLVGRTDGTVSVSQCYVGGQTHDGRYAYNAPQAKGENPKTTDGNIYINSNNKTVYAGGLVGYAGKQETISDSYNTASIGVAGLDIMGNGSRIGGLAGYTAASATIKNSYFVAYILVPISVNQGPSVGGIIGGAGGTIAVDSDSYYVIEFMTVVPDLIKNTFGVARHYNDCPKAAESSKVVAYTYDDFYGRKPTYSYVDVTGLGHHWGDWSEIPSQDVRVYYYDPDGGVFLGQ